MFSVITTPLTMTRLSYPGRPEMMNWTPDRAFELTPGERRAAANGVRATGRASICLAVNVDATCGVSSTDGALAVTVIASATFTSFMSASTREVCDNCKVV